MTTADQKCLAAAHQLAEHCGKRHADVFRCIREIIADLPEDGRTFALVEYPDEIGRAMTDSLIVAEHFGKQHSHVMQAIREIMSDLPELEGQSTFRPAQYSDAQGKLRARMVMNRDGAMLLTNTFKGRRARLKQWQVIQAINALEAHVRKLEVERVSSDHAKRARCQFIQRRERREQLANERKGSGPEPESSPKPAKTEPGGLSNATIRAALGLSEAIS